MPPVPPQSATTSTAPDSSRTKSILENHLRHIYQHFKRLRQGYATVPEPKSVYLGGSEGQHFWELIGMRLSGHPAPVLGLVRFQRHDLPGVPFAREPLSTYLSTPTSEGRRHRPAAMLDVVLPRANQDIPGFLRNHRSGNTPPPVRLDPSIVDLAFDFRMGNPFAIEASRLCAEPLKKRLFRTARGHVLTGLSHDPADPHLTDMFIAVKNPVQHSRKGRTPLPYVALNRAFVAVSAEVEDEKTRLAAVHWVPFAPSSGVTRHLLLA